MVLKTHKTSKPLYRLSDSLVILGKGESRHELEINPEKYNGFEIWTLNEARHEKATRHFEVHAPRHHDCSDLEVPVYITTFEQNEKFDSTLKFGRLYPKDAIREKLRIPNLATGTVPAEMSLALASGFKEIYLLGVDYISAMRPQEKSALLFWVGMAVGMGVKVVMSEISTVFDFTSKANLTPKQTIQLEIIFDIMKNIELNQEQLNKAVQLFNSFKK